MAGLYLAIMEDVFKTNQGDRNAEIKKLQSEIDKNMELMDKSARKFVNDDLDKFDYKLKLVFVITAPTSIAFIACLLFIGSKFYCS
jgi:hypothetical protein